MSALSDLLMQHKGDRSVRQIGRDCGQYGVGESTVIPYFNGKHGDNPPEEVLYALSQVIPLDIGLLREAAGVPRGESDPYTAPAEFNRLSHSQRTALDEFVRSFVGPQGARNAMEAAQEQDAPTQGRQAQKTDGQSPDKPGLKGLAPRKYPRAKKATVRRDENGNKDQQLSGQ